MLVLVLVLEGAAVKVTIWKRPWKG